MDNEIHGEKIDEHAVWLVEQLDPDNFAFIPEFDVMPQSVKWAGFRTPIVFPGVKNRLIAESMREMLITARRKIRKHFDTLSEIYRLADEIDVLPEASLTERHRDVRSFMQVQIGIEQAAIAIDSGKDSSMYLTFAGAALSYWQSRDEIALSRSLAKSRGSNGGKKSGEKRAEMAIDKNAVVIAAKELGWPAKTYGVQKKLSTAFNCDASYIAKILAAVKKNSGLKPVQS